MAEVRELEEIDTNIDLEAQKRQLQWFIDHPPSRPIRTWISPELAEYIAGKVKNPRNRDPKTKVLKAIQENGYVFIAGMVIFGSDGHLIDAQNRMLACAQSGEAIEIFMTFGWDPEIFKLVDSGANRSGADLLKTEGVENPKEVADAVRWIVHITRAWDSVSGTIKRPVLHAYNVLEFYRAHIDGRNMQTCVDMALKIRREIDPKYVTPILYLAYQAKEYDKARKFVDDLYLGRKRSKAWHLKEALFEAIKKNHQRIENIKQVAWIIQTLNGDEFDKTWAQKNPFPTIK